MSVKLLPPDLIETFSLVLHPRRRYSFVSLESLNISTTPSILSISPSSGPVSGGTSVTITGTNFTGATAVSVDGVALASFSVVNSSTITGTTAAGTIQGTGNVVVTNGAGTGTLTNGWTYTFSPSDVSNLTAWFRADLGVSLDGSNNIQQWNDQSGNGNNVTQSNAGLRPSQPAANASYNNQMVFSTNISTFLSLASITASQPITFLMIGKCTTSNGVAIATSTSASLFPLVENFSNQITINAGSTYFGSGGFHLPCAGYVEFNGASSRACVNNWLSNSTTGNAGTNGGTKLAFGAYTDGGFGGACDFAEVIIYSRLLSANEQAQLAAYVTSRYGFTIT